MSDRGEYRSVRVVIVDGPDFKQTNPDTKLVWLYIKFQLGPVGLGVFNAAQHVLAEQTGLTPRRVGQALKELDASPQFFRREGNLFWIVGGLKNDPSMRCTNKNHVQSVREIVNALPRLALIDEFKGAHPEWFEGAPEALPQTPSPSIGRGDAPGDAIPHAAGINGRRKTEDGIQKTEDGRQKTDAEGTAPPRDRFLDQFYPEKTTDPKRRAEVARQLDQLLKPEGLLIRRDPDVVARAQGLDHLNRALSDVLRGPPPRIPDAAIVLVFKKLGDPIKDLRGRTVTEAASETNRETDQLLERWQVARERAVKTWMNNHKAEAEEIERLVASQSDSEFALRGMLMIEYTKAAEFPDFETWAEKQAVPA